MDIHTSIANHTGDNVLAPFLHVGALQSQWDELPLEVADLHFKVAFAAMMISSSLPPCAVPFLVAFQDEKPLH